MYKKQTWVNNESELNADRLNHMEDGIETAQSQLETGLQSVVNELNLKAYNGKNIIGMNALSKTFTETSNTVKFLRVMGYSLQSLLGKQNTAASSEDRVNLYYGFKLDNTFNAGTSIPSGSTYKSGNVYSGHKYLTIIKFNGGIPSNLGSCYFSGGTAVNGNNNLEKASKSGTYVFAVCRMSTTYENTAYMVRVTLSASQSYQVAAMCVIDLTDKGMEGFTASQLADLFSNNQIESLMNNAILKSSVSVSLTHGSSTTTIGSYNFDKDSIIKTFQFNASSGESTINITTLEDQLPVLLAASESDLSKSVLFSYYNLNDAIAEIKNYIDGELQTSLNDLSQRITLTNLGNYKGLTGTSLNILGKAGTLMGIRLSGKTLTSLIGKATSSATFASTAYLTTDTGSTTITTRSGISSYNKQVTTITGHYYLTVVKTNLQSTPTNRIGYFTNITAVNGDNSVSRYFTNGYEIVKNKITTGGEGGYAVRWNDSNSKDILGMSVIDMTLNGIENLTPQEAFEYFGSTFFENIMNGGGVGSTCTVNLIQNNVTTQVGTYDAATEGLTKTLYFTPTNANATLQIVPGSMDILYAEDELDLNETYTFESVDLPLEVQKISNRVSELESNSIVRKNADIRHVVEAAAVAGYSQGGSYKDKQFTMLIMTDVHGCDDRIKAYTEYADYMDCIDIRLSLGDVSNSMFGNAILPQYKRYDAGTVYSRYRDEILKGSTPFYPAIGNHDAGITYVAQKYINGDDLDIYAGTYKGGVVGKETQPYEVGVTYPNTSFAGTKTDQFNFWIKPFLDEIGMSSVTKTYYSKKFDDYKVVLIVMDAFDCPDTYTDSTEENFKVARDTPCYSQAQINWLISELGNVPSDYHVVIAAHWLPVSVDQVLCNFTCTRNGAYNVTGYPIVYPDLIPDIINAWKNKTTLTKTYAPQGGTWKGGDIQECPTLNVSCDYSSRTASHFACYLGGHEHADVVAKVHTYPDQYTILFAASALDLYRNAQNDLPRIVEDDSSRTQDALTTVTIDVQKKAIKLVRIGSNKSFDLVDRTYLELVYE